MNGSASLSAFCVLFVQPSLGPRVSVLWMKSLCGPGTEAGPTEHVFRVVLERSPGLEFLLCLPCSSLVFQGSLFHILSLHFLTWREKNPQPSQSCWGSIKKRKKIWKWRAFKMIRVLLFINWRIFLWEVTDRRVNLWRKIINNIINEKYYNK